MVRMNFRAMLYVVGVFCFVGGISAQTRSSVADTFLISAKAGGVNEIEGTVTVARANGTAGVLLRRDRIEIGDKVQTGSDGRAEVLLNPGSYIRLGRNSSFEFGTTDLEDLQLRLESGSAIFEVFAANEFRVTVSTPKGKVALIETGIYRIDVDSNGNALLSVTKGKADIGEANATRVKEGRTGTVGQGAVAIAKFDKGKRDDLAQWSKDRSKELTKVASSLQARQLNTSILGGFRRGLWNVYDSFGLWVYDARFGGYCFLPFGHDWRSPYGGWYRNGIYVNNPQIYNPWIPAQTRPKVSSRIPRVESGGGDSSTKVSSREGSRDNYGPPPFTKVGRGGDSGGGSIFTNSNGRNPVDFSPGRSSSGPSYSPPVSSPPPPPVSAPAKVSSRGN